MHVDRGYCRARNSPEPPYPRPNPARVSVVLPKRAVVALAHFTVVVVVFDSLKLKAEYNNDV